MKLERGGPARQSGVLKYNAHLEMWAALASLVEANHGTARAVC